MNTIENRLLHAIKKEIENALEEAVDEAAERAAEEARIAVKNKLAEIALRLTNEIDMERVGQILTIRVKV
jgi:vacuolar-type H+-ATPase subunit E/Vma4